MTATRKSSELKDNGILSKSSDPAKKPSLTGLARARTGSSHVDTPWRYRSAFGIAIVIHTRNAAKGFWFRPAR